MALASLIAAACSDDGPNAGGGDTGIGAGGGDLTVSAASSLTEAFTEIGKAFEKANPGTTVAFNFGPSDGLAGQIDEGARSTSSHRPVRPGWTRSRTTDRA